ncbi:thiosulfate oxidation carrier protein SoxY [Thauera linaloolentis]|uniref:Tat pathway signal sequence domain-containing protein 24 n=1 Tax=Thauera linaloolentis (strain DSM 12138 / JCM 21573 / CCUG 41526 / CIP 105981 / IAM 15112 / NBRC 102519 / 47Lol) TaxID=1123367 RepID=N6ZBA6_THAL4|nr:thiosulfate oxidation carrier protein SoxY [Thauera linaloolentis]ENO89464.1 Tat pathway signal sequence domain-containing protein 24 [Thauera linaloolentis 47Lol = DSM 12138]MCM8566899.1 thiosulfate oxidation carrier protein SoxY [Thauera linaloolentis]
MDHQRRDTLKAGGGLGVFGLLVAAGVIKPELAQAAWNAQAFEARSLEAAFGALGAGKPAASDGVLITSPDIAENGAVVPVGVVSNIPGTEYIAIMVEKNPYMLAASFIIPEGTVAELQTRVKMSQTSDVHALVKANGKFYTSRKEVKVTLGGCGG